MTIARRIRVDGVVQGVFFRDWTVRVARELGLTGWVRNLRGGGVELLAEGATDQIDRLIVRLREGPPAARVDHLSAEDVPVEGASGFSRRPTV